MKTKTTVFSLLTLLVLISSMVFQIVPAKADFTNGGFETGTFANWTSPNDMPVVPETVFLNNGIGSGVTRGAGGSNKSAVVGVGIDPIAGISTVHTGAYAARLNDSTGFNQNANSIRQTVTVQPGDVQGDGSVHLRFAYAPVLEDPGHNPADQPYFFVGVRNITTGQTLYQEFAYANQPGYPWQAAGGWKYMDWQEVDLVSYPANPVMHAGDQIELEAIGAGCALGGHAGYVYVDDFGFALPSTGPSLLNITPNSGPDYGGTTVTVTGTHLDTVTAIGIGTDSVPAASFVSQTASTIVFVTPGDPAGWVTVTVVNPSGSAAFFNGFDYLSDVTPPVITVPANMTVEATSGSGAVVTFTATATDETAPANPAVTCVPPSGSTFPLGTTTVNCSATDTAGNTGTNSFTITVQDTTAPTLFLPADFSVLQALPGGAIVTYSATATDAVGPANPIVTCFPASGSLFPVGFTTVNCSATDTAGNTAIGKFHVTVIPNINLLKNPGFDLQVGSMYWTYNKPRVSFKTLVDCEVFISPSCSLEFTVTRKNIAELQTVTQTVSVPLGQAGDQYSWGIYSQANFLPAAGTYQVNLSFVNNLGKTVGTQTMVFATGVTDWQLYNSMFTAPASYVKIIYKLTFQKKSFSDWSAYLDDAFLYSMGNTR
jgi:hypothetical protein